MIDDNGQNMPQANDDTDMDDMEKGGAAEEVVDTDLGSTGLDDAGESTTTETTTDDTTTEE